MTEVLRRGGFHKVRIEVFGPSLLDGDGLHPFLLVQGRVGQVLVYVGLLVGHLGTKLFVH